MDGCFKLPYKQNKHLKSSYTYTTPIYGTAYKKRHYSHSSTKEFLYLPRNIQKLKKLGVTSYDIKLNTKTVKSPVKFKTPYKLYDYQQRDLDKVTSMFKTDINVLFKAPTRYGKVIFILGLIEHLQQKTLIVVDKTLLVTEFISEANKFMDIDIGRLNKTNINKHDITITTVQFLHANQHLLKQFDVGLMVVDEVHAVTSKSFINVVNSIGTRYRFGLSATPTNSNKLEEIITDLFEPVKLEGINPKDIKVKLARLTMPKQYNPFSNSSIKESYNEYWLQYEVMQCILNDIKLHPNAIVFIATPSKAVQYAYAEALESIGRSVRVFNSDSKDHTDGLALINDGQVNSMVGFGVLTKGVSVKMDRLYSLDSASTKEPLQQLLGRLKTPYDKKPQPIFTQCISKFETRKDVKVFKILNGLSDTITEEVNNENEHW